jgi:hypothetical protein
LLDLRPRQIELRPVVAIIDSHQRHVGIDGPIVSDRHVDDGAGALGTDGDRSRIDIGIVSRFELPGMEPPDQDAERG